MRVDPAVSKKGATTTDQPTGLHREEATATVISEANELPGLAQRLLDATIVGFALEMYQTKADEYGKLSLLQVCQPTPYCRLCVQVPSRFPPALA